MLDKPASPASIFHSVAETPVEWLISDGLVSYPQALELMDKRAKAIAAGEAAEAVWLLEHPPLYTAGTSAKAGDLLHAGSLPVFETGRGGQYTYHGPGQRVAYVMLNLRARKPDVRAFVNALEDWIIDTLSAFHVRGEKRCERIGIWVKRSERRDDKIAALGIRLKQWVSLHGIAINVDPDLSHFGGIVPCGITEHGVTSLADLGVTVGMADVDIALRLSFEKVFGKTQ